jgi:4-amino-4-deoxy-L-arabinose transferase-like glycosyltransferase
MNRARQLSAAIFIVALLVRLLPLGLYVTPDEPIWVLRSLQFLEAIKAGDLGRMPQTGHPGVTTMALGALGAWLTTLLYPSEAAVHADWALRIAVLAPENGAAFPHLAFFLPLARVVVAATVSACVALAYLLGRRRVGERSARLLALFLALDPFFAGHAGLLHTDALQATAVLLAVLWVLPVEAGRERRGAWSDWVALGGAALMLALAGLTKMLGLLAAPGVALALFLTTEGTWRQRAVRVAVLTGLTVLFLLVLYPPVWVDPRVAVQSLIAAVTYHEGIGLRPVFFAGRTTTDPGPWFYPVVLLFRLTPPVLLGLVWVRPGEGCGLKRSLRHSHRRLRSSRSCAIVLGGLLPVLSYSVAITIAGKKFDRYVLTVIPLLTLVAAHRWSRVRRSRRSVLLALLLLPWSVVALIPLQYATPLLGGPWVAQHVVPLGWGEASGLAVHALRARGEAGSWSTLMARNVPGAASLFPGETWAWDARRLGCTELLIDAETPAPEGYLRLDDVYAGGRRQTSIYIHGAFATDAPGTGLQAFDVRASETVPSLPLVAPGPLPGVPDAAVVPAGDTVQLQVWLSERFAAGEPFLRLRAPHCYPLAEAQLDAVFSALPQLPCEPADPVVGFESERCRFTGQGAPEDLQPVLARFGGAVDLVAAAWPATVRSPDPLTVRLRWQPHVLPDELDVYLALRDAGGTRDLIWAEGGQRVLNDWGWPAPAWRPGAIVDAEAYVLLPLSLAPGRYQLVLRLAGSAGWLGLSRADGTFAGTELVLGAVEVAPASQPAGQLSLPTLSEVAWPGVTVIAFRGPAERVEAGRPLTFDLGLQRDSGTPPEALVWRLVCEGGQEVEGLLPWPVSDPSHWSEGFRYVLRYAARVPAIFPAGSCEMLVAPVEADRLASLSLGAVRVETRERLSELPATPAFEPAVVAEGLAQLVGADVAPRAVRPGEALSVTLYWRALGAAERDDTFFVQLIGPEGQVWGQSDSWPAGGTASTMTWVSGEIIVDRHDLTLSDGAPAGRVGIYVGLYDADSGVRRALYEAGARLSEDRARITEVEVVP